MTNQAPDIFRNVHKGIRHALASACTALGRAGSEAEAERARATLQEALRFVKHHGENEDLLLLPLLSERVPAVAASMGEAHHALEAQIAALSRDALGGEALYLAACAFTADYLRHMDDEETRHEPSIRAALSVEELQRFSQQSVQRTAPADQRMMLGYMLPAMTRADVEAFLGRLPPALAAELRSLRD